MLESIVLFIVLVVLLYLWKNKRPHNFPPGPTPLPILGNILQLPPGLFSPVIEEWAKQYGPIIGLSIMSTPVIAVTGVDSVLAALRKEEFQSRIDNFQMRDRSMGKMLGLFGSNGDQWASSRKFTVKQMRAFGKNERENIMADEISRLMEEFKGGSTIQGTGIFGVSAVNVIWTVIANKRLDVNDEKSRKFLKNLYELFRQGNASGGDVVKIVPSLRFLSPKYRSSMQIMRDTQDYIRTTIKEHKEVLDPNNPMDVIDHYLVVLEEEKNNPYFTEDDLVMIGLDLFSAGAESTSNSIEFVLLYMILYPEVQEKLQQELDRVLGRSRKPVLADKSELHYTMAVLNEVERVNTIAPMNVPHCCSKDTTFGDYFIPKDTNIFMNLRSLGNDPKYWKNPEDFVPERFLNADGKYTKSPHFQAFGMGTRACVGEVFARNTIFLFTTTFLEKYSVSLPAGDPEPSTVPLAGFTTAPQPFRITIKSRY